MPGAQPRRAPVARTLSASRRGSNVPAGVPGVYRVPRVRSVPAQTSDPGRPSVVAGWVQPDDVDETASKDFLRTRYEHNTGSVDPVVWADWPNLYDGTSPAVIQTAAAVGGVVLVQGDVWVLECYCHVGNFMDLPCDPVSPSPPPGMSAEYESAQGYIVSATVSGAIDGDTGGGYAVQLDDAHTGWPTPADLAGGAVLAYSATGGSSDSYSVDFTPGVGSRDVGVFACAQELHYNNTPPDDLVSEVDIKSLSAAATLSCNYTYRPPRYRFV